MSLFWRGASAPGFSGLLVTAIYLAATVSGGAEARRMIVRGRLGPVVSRNIPGNAFLGVFPQAPGVALQNGRLFERTRNGLRPLFASRNGRILNATRASTASQVARVLRDNFNSLDARGRDLATRIIGANSALAGVGLPTASAPPPPIQAPVPSGVANGTNANCGFSVGGPNGHGGAGRCGDAAGRAAKGVAGSGTGRQEAVAASPIGADGRVTPAVCANFNRAICGGRDAQAEERLVFATGRGVTNSFAAKNPDVSLSQVFANVLRNPGRFFGQYADYLKFASEQAGQFDAVAAQTLDRVRENLDTTPFPPETRERMKKKLDGLTIRMTPRADLASLRSFIANCGADGMTNAAFTVPDRKEIIVCPGMALRAKALGGDLKSNIEFVLAHECNHNCGADRFPNGTQSEFRPQFLAFGACLEKKFSGFRSAGMLGEITADQLGLGAIAKEMAGMNPADAFAFLKQATSPLCGTPSDGVHPAGDVRVNAGIGNNAEILQILGCTAPRDICSLNGETSR